MFLKIAVLFSFVSLNFCQPYTSGFKSPGGYQDPTSYYKPGNPVQGCYYNGRYYYVGQSFPAIDGCNTCTCLANGNAGCTRINCERPGRCPVAFAGAISRRHGPVCRNDFDCPPPQKCCYDFAGRRYCAYVGKRY